jgi:glucose-6-phosphate-specific signal transduction histidine kinase
VETNYKNPKVVKAQDRFTWSLAWHGGELRWTPLKVSIFKHRTVHRWHPKGVDALTPLEWRCLSIYFTLLLVYISLNLQKA